MRTHTRGSAIISFFLSYKKYCKYIISNFLYSPKRQSKTLQQPARKMKINIWKMNWIRKWVVARKSIAILRRDPTLTRLFPLTEIAVQQGQNTTPFSFRKWIGKGKEFVVGNWITQREKCCSNGSLVLLNYCFLNHIICFFYSGPIWNTKDVKSFPK